MNREAKAEQNAADNRRNIGCGKRGGQRRRRRRVRNLIPREGQRYIHILTLKKRRMNMLNNFFITFMNFTHISWLCYTSKNV